MRYTLKLFLIAVTACTVSFTVYGQRGLDDVLAEIEENSPSLAARRKLTYAETMDAKTGNSLENPEVEYSQTWGHPSELGKNGELTVTQSFDFPTLYANRNKLAKLRAEQYGLEYAAYRQELLLEANILCIEVVSLYEKNEMYRMAFNDASAVMELMDAKYATGNANALEYNKAKFEYMNAMNIYRMNEVELSSAMNRLSAMNGDKPLDISGIKLDNIPGVPPYEEMKGRYEESYPELQAVMMGLNIAEQDVKVNRAQSLPKITLGYKNEFAKGERFNGIVVGMSIPMFGNKNNVKSAKARNVYAEAELKRAKSELGWSIAELYAKEAILRHTVEEYHKLQLEDTTPDLLRTALEAEHISLVEYFAQLQPVYDGCIAMIDARKDLHVICATINMIDL